MNTNMLYHYTDFPAFDGIIRSAVLRLNNILNMNDAAEMRLFMNGICNATLDRLESDCDTEKLHMLSNFFQNELEKEFHYSAYAACFSKYRDDAAQWERYGRSGQGVCIAFYEDRLQELVGGAISLLEVYYQSDMQEHQLVNAFCDCMNQSDDFMEAIPRLQELMLEAWVRSAAFKHPSFSSEKESRLVASPFIKSDFAIEPQYHVSKGRIKKYYPLDLNLMCSRHNMNFSDLVGEIIIGPTSLQSLPILQDYLEDCGLGVLKDKVILSDCPLLQPIT